MWLFQKRRVTFKNCLTFQDHWITSDPKFSKTYNVSFVHSNQSIFLKKYLTDKSHLYLIKNKIVIFPLFQPIKLQIFCILTISSCYRTVPSAIWEIFSEFLIFCNLFHEPLGEWNNSKIWETRKIFANIARGNVR